MDSRNGHANREHDALERIVALLLALAGLAEMAGAVAARRRRRALGILARGEAAARAFLTGMAPDTPFRNVAPCLEDVPDPAGAPAGDALLLAARLRALALMLVAMLARAALSERPGLKAGGRGPAGHACRQATSPAPDTS
ncbi:MAG: hypothetical protein WDZ83_08675 [Rhizobiaceae bacterium]